MVKGLPYEGVKVSKATVAYMSLQSSDSTMWRLIISKVLTILWINNAKGSLAWRNLKCRFVCRLYGKKKALWYKGSSS